MTMLFLISAVIVIITVTWAFSKTKHPLINAAKSAASGIGSMLFINVLSGYTGCYIAINPRTVFISATLSLPGVLSLLVMKIIFNY